MTYDRVVTRPIAACLLAACLLSLAPAFAVAAPSACQPVVSDMRYGYVSVTGDDCPGAQGTGGFVLVSGPDYDRLVLLGWRGYIDGRAAWESYPGGFDLAQSGLYYALYGEVSIWAIDVDGSPLFWIDVWRVYLARVAR